VFRPRAVEEQAEPFDGADAEVVPALRAHVDVCGEILVVDRLLAAGTLDPQPFGHAARLLLRRRPDRLTVLLEPPHSDSLTEGRKAERQDRKAGRQEGRTERQEGRKAGRQKERPEGCLSFLPFCLSFLPSAFPSCLLPFFPAFLPSCLRSPLQRLQERDEL